MKPHTSPLLIRPQGKLGEYLRVTARTADWEHLHFSARRMERGEQWQASTGDYEYGLVILGGVCCVQSSRGSWDKIGRRPNVFSGMPYALYLPPQTSFTVTALSDALDLACGWCRCEGEHPPQLVTPEQVAIEIRGGGNATRQINSLFPPGFDCHRLVAVEVYTPPGNWSSYPRHKHDVHRVDAVGNLIEADLEEIYFYKLEPKVDLRHSVRLKFFLLYPYTIIEFQQKGTLFVNKYYPELKQSPQRAPYLRIPAV